MPAGRRPALSTRPADAPGGDTVDRGKHTFIDKVKVRLVDSDFWAEVANFGHKNVHIPEHYVRDYERLVMGGVWSQIDMRFEYDEESKGKNPFWIDKLTPIQIAKAALLVVLGGAEAELDLLPGDRLLSLGRHAGHRPSWGRGGRRREAGGGARSAPSLVRGEEDKVVVVGPVGSVGNPQGCPSDGGERAQPRSAGARWSRAGVAGGVVRVLRRRGTVHRPRGRVTNAVIPARFSWPPFCRTG